MSNKRTLLTSKELATRIKFSRSYINSTLKDTVFLEGVHYVRPFGGKKIFYIWEEVEKAFFESGLQSTSIIPMAKGGICNG